MLVTAFAANGVIAEAITEGIRKVIPKPVNWEYLLPIIDEIVGKR
jgi:hypothetical protein